MPSIHVLIVEDDPMVVEIHRRCIGQVEGYRVVASAGTGERALELFRTLEVDLMILDIFMPGLDGVETLKTLRKESSAPDVIVVSAANDVTRVNEMMQMGVFDYVVKPFRFERMHETLESYKTMRQKLKSTHQGAYRQEEIDSIYRVKGSRIHTPRDLPKGLSAPTLGRLLALLGETKEPMSAERAAAETGLSRVTARRYLEYLVATGKVQLQREYQEVGRPKKLYHLV